MPPDSFEFHCSPGSFFIYYNYYIITNSIAMYCSSKGVTFLVCSYLARSGKAGSSLQCVLLTTLLSHRLPSQDLITILLQEAMKQERLEC